MAQLTFNGRALIPGEAEGEAVKVDSISFYGDVDPDKGVLGDGRPVAGKVLVARRGRGSTVGSYVILSLKYNGKAPAAILMERAEPIIVVGAYLAGIPLVDKLPREFFEKIRDGALVRVRGGEVVAEV